jgi:hypothetical protein
VSKGTAKEKWLPKGAVNFFYKSFSRDINVFAVVQEKNHENSIREILS